MGIFDRLSTLLRSNINDLISRAENPEKMLDQILVDMKGQLAKAKQQVASAIADEKKSAGPGRAEKKQSEDWERRAMLAVQEGRDDLAKQALVRHSEHCRAPSSCTSTWVQHKAETEKLKNSLRELNDKIEEAKRKKNILVARASAAPRPSSASRRRCPPLREERLRGVRADGRADRAQRAQGDRRGRDPGGVLGGLPGAASSSRWSTRAAATSSSSSSRPRWECWDPGEIRAPGRSARAAKPSKPSWWTTTTRSGTKP